MSLRMTLGHSPSDGGACTNYQTLLSWCFCEQFHENLIASLREILRWSCSNAEFKIVIDTTKSSLWFNRGTYKQLSGRQQTIYAKYTTIHSPIVSIQRTAYINICASQKNHHIIKVYLYELRNIPTTGEVNSWIGRDAPRACTLTWLAECKVYPVSSESV